MMIIIFMLFLCVLLLVVAAKRVAVSGVDAGAGVGGFRVSCVCVGLVLLVMVEVIVVMFLLVEIMTVVVALMLMVVMVILLVVILLLEVVVGIVMMLVVVIVMVVLGGGCGESDGYAGGGIIVGDSESVAGNGGDIATAAIGSDDYDSGCHVVIGVGLLKQENIVERAGALSYRGLCSSTGFCELLSASNPVYPL